MFYELFDDRESGDLLDEMLHDGEYEEIRSYRERPLHETDEQVRMFLAGTLPGGQLHWAIRDIKSGPCVGSLQVTASGGAFFVGYRIATLSRGAGRATQALQWLVQELRRISPMTHIRATVGIENTASMHVLSKNGFVAVAGDVNATSRQHLFEFERET